MDVFVKLRSALLTMPAVTAIVGGDTSSSVVTTPARIWNTWPRTYATPCIVMDVDSEEESPHLTGQGELVIAQVVITCRADSSSQSHALQEAVRSGLSAYTTTDFSLDIDSTARSQTPKNEGSADHWYDNVMDCTFYWSEAT